MNVQEIIARVAEFSLDEMDSDNQLQARILSDLNQVYQEVLQAAADSDMDALLSVDVTLSNGSASLGINPSLIASVRDTQNGNLKLQKTDILTLEDKYPAMDSVGAPTYWYMTAGEIINAYPANDTVLRVRYFPKYTALTTSSAESDIKIPFDHHQVLVDGCLYYMKLREQGFHNQLDRRESWDKYQLRLGDYLRAVEARGRGSRYTEYHDF